MSDAVSRRGFLAGSAGALATPTAQPAPGPAAPQAVRKPNFILYMPDTLRAESIGCYGHPVVRTPNLDRLAREQVADARSFVPAARTAIPAATG